MEARRIIRAFMWMRWRVFINALERTSARDTLDRLSLAAEKLGPIMALVLLIPSSVALFVLGIGAGFGVATGSWTVPMEVVRYFLLADLVLTVVGPLVLSASGGTNATRLLLLPIPRGLLYTAAMSGVFADPWILLMVPLLMGVPVGFAVGLAFIPALVVFIAGLAFLVFVAGITAFVSFAIQVLLRDRRRGDIVMLAVVILISLAGMAPQLILPASHRGNHKLTAAERNALPPSRAARLATAVAPYVPSEAYHHAAISATATPVRALIPAMSLGILALVVQGFGFVMFRKLLDTPMTIGARHAGSLGEGLWNRVIPGLSPAASAVAFTQLRLALRTPRGRSVMAMPLIMTVALGAIAYRNGGHVPFPGLPHVVGLGLATLGGGLSILMLLPLSMNQFAIDRAGFTRQMLVPLTIHDLLLGKAAGNALIACVPAAIAVVLPPLIFRDVSFSEWICVPLGLTAMFVMTTPASAALSAVFPKTVDLSTIGNRSQPHQVAGLLGMVTMAASAAPAILIVVLTRGLLHRPALAPVLLAGWCVAALVIASLLFIPVERLVGSRTETLAQY